MMNQEVANFLTSERVCGLAVVMPDGTSHSAAMHFSHRAEPLALFFSTENTSRKCQALLNGKPSKASVVVGFSEEKWLTLQMDGEVKAILNPEELKVAKAVHYPKHPNSQKYEHDPATVFLAFTPSWWRYTGFKFQPPIIIESK